MNNNIQEEIENIIKDIIVYCHNNGLKLPEFLNSAKEMLLSAHLNIGLIGAFNSGKSTLLNCLIGKDLLPRGFLPTTAAITTIDFSENEELKYELRDGQIQTTTFKNENIKSLISVKKIEKEDEVSKVWIKYPINYGRNISFIDTPGIDDIDELRSLRTVSILSQVDVAILLFVHPITSTVLNFLKENVIGREINKIFFCMTHIDKGGVRENIEKVYEDNEKEIEKMLGFKPVIHAIDLLGCLNSISRDGQKSNEFIQFENEFRHFIEGSEAKKILFGRAITKIQYT
ncbi:MAG: dynamin family protein, partial [Ignavibacteria bacterium]